MKIASSPCSFGIYYGQATPADPERYVAGSAAAGYDGVDLGPEGFLGSLEDMSSLLRKWNVGLAGAYVTFGELGEPASDRERDRLESTLTRFDAARDAAPHLPPPVLTLAGGAATSEHLEGWRVGSYGGVLVSDETDALAARIEAIAAHVAAAGYRTSIHPHLSTIIETWADTVPLVAKSSAGVCVDTGHLWLAGDDPLEVIRSASVVDLVHLKDASRADWRAAIDAAEPGTHPWRERGFCRLGAGDLSIDRILEALRDRSFDGWIVIEEDRPVDDGSTPWSSMLEEQRANREFLARRMR